MKSKTTTIEDVVAYYRDLQQQLLGDQFGEDLPEEEKIELQKKYNQKVSDVIKFETLFENKNSINKGEIIVFNLLKSYLAPVEEEPKRVPADKESLEFLEKIVYALRGKKFKDTPKQVEIEDLVHGCYRNFDELELRVSLANYHSSFRDIHNVLMDKPFHNCEIDPETREKIIEFIELFGEGVQRYFYENGSKFINLHKSVDDIIALQKFPTNDKNKKTSF